jgi:hypothetical protein
MVHGDNNGFTGVTIEDTFQSDGFTQKHCSSFIGSTGLIFGGWLGCDPGNKKGRRLFSACGPLLVRWLVQYDRQTPQA